MNIAHVICRRDGLSDRHNGGKTASLLETESGKFILKPRSPATDCALGDFVDALEALDAPNLPRCVRPVAPYGESETLVPFIENTPAQTQSDVRAYFLRCGSLLALCEMLGATDLHAENLIACKDSPVVVDLETLLAGKLPDRGQYYGGLSDGLMYSHLLPNWMLEGDDNRDIGGLTGSEKNQLCFEGKPCPAYEHTADIIEGFAQAYDFILSHKPDIERALHLFDRAQFRKLLRPTEVYGRLVDRIELLSDEAEKQQQADRLRRAYDRDPNPEWRERMARVCASEIDAVLRLDIPYFFSYGSEKCLRDFMGVVCEDYFAVSPVENAINRLHRMNEADKRDQMKIIAQSLNTANPSIDAIPVSAPQDVFDLLEARALETNPCSWICVDTDDKGRAYLQSIGFDLYNGLLGVLCFYAALYEAAGDRRVKQAIQKRYAPYRKMYIEKPSPIPARADSISLTHGVGGHLLALDYLSRCLREDAYLRDAETLLSRFDFANMDDIQGVDVYGGVSGLLIALPCLMGRGMDAFIQTIAEPLADKLSIDNPALTGYAHGAAGEALALACAQTVLGDHRYEADIQRMLSAENATYDAKTHNWPDLRDSEKHGFMNGLCSGAPGIGIARKQMLNLRITPETRAICEADIARVRSYYLAAPMCLKRDSLCCGNAARMEGEKALFGEIRTARLNDAPVLFHPLETNDFSAGLLQGWAGVGYALTRALPASHSGILIDEMKE